VHTTPHTTHTDKTHPIYIQSLKCGQQQPDKSTAARTALQNLPGLLASVAQGARNIECLRRVNQSLEHHLRTLSAMAAKK
jgi:hypothetical protein